MQFKNMRPVDLELALLSGDSIEVDNLTIKPYTLREIKDYGYSRYMNNLRWISLSVDDFIKEFIDENKKKILEEQRDRLKVFDFYIRLGGKELQDFLLESLSMILRTDDLIIIDSLFVGIDFKKMGFIRKREDGLLIVDEDKLNSHPDEEVKFVHRDNFDDIIKVARLQNYMDKIPEEEEIGENPADEETRKLIEQMKKYRKKVEKAKKSSQGESKDKITLPTIISAVSSKSNSINRFNIWDLTVYQLYDEFARLELIDVHENASIAMMTGMVGKIDIKHWASKL